MSTPTTSEQITLGGGCFWCLEAGYQEVRGVTMVVSGYAGGQRPNPTYEQVCTGVTGHAEVVQLTFDPAEVTFEQLLDVFWTIHNPTTVDRQGNDVGSQYRSIILYTNDSQRRRAQASRDAVQEFWTHPIVTQIVPLEAFYPAEEEHQNYFRKHPEAGYCQAIINPKLTKLRRVRADLLKAD